MWNSIVNVAKSRMVHEKKLTIFALQNVDKYRITTDLGYPEVNTWNVDGLLADFKATEQDAQH